MVIRPKKVHLTNSEAQQIIVGYRDSNIRWTNNKTDGCRSNGLQMIDIGGSSTSPALARLAPRPHGLAVMQRTCASGY